MEGKSNNHLQAQMNGAASSANHQ
ncbi:uncharacterized protein G2W53_039411 [Senna tora]|uniref:Uncharacterized protein n=1 Tax=Senna tora TaxID=362788 RepID=A0A834SMG1_9FABA|nr:uncharacterized protein G2W53_039411 [Senna tora]